MAVCIGFLLAGGCARKPVEPPYPHESVLTVIAELKIFLEQDPYHLAPGTDLDGRNIYRVSLQRINQLEELLSDEYRDILAFARAQCMERLGEWRHAEVFYEQSAAYGTRLAPEAEERAAAARHLRSLLDRSQFSQSLESYLNELEVQERQLNEWAETDPPWPYASLARAEAESIREELVGLLLMNRRLLARGSERALEAAQRLAERYHDSYRAGEHRLLLGSIYETLARDWAVLHRPDTLGFDEGEALWTGWIEKAREAYRAVAQSDGDPAKPEARARLRALEAYALRIQERAR